MVVAEVSYGVQGADSTSNGRNPPCTFTSLTTQLSPQSSKSPFTHGRYLNEEKKKGRQGGKEAGRQAGRKATVHKDTTTTTPQPNSTSTSTSKTSNSDELFRTRNGEPSQPVSQSVSHRQHRQHRQHHNTNTNTNTHKRQKDSSRISLHYSHSHSHPPTHFHSFIHFHHGHSLSTLSLRRRSPQLSSLHCSPLTDSSLPPSLTHSLTTTD